MNRGAKIFAVLTILLAAVFASGAPAAAETGLHCNQNVCFDVHGKKLNVSGVDGYYSNKNYSIHCGFMILFVNGKAELPVQRTLHGPVRMGTETDARKHQPQFRERHSDLRRNSRNTGPQEPQRPPVHHGAFVT